MAGAVQGGLGTWWVSLSAAGGAYRPIATYAAVPLPLSEGPPKPLLWSAVAVSPSAAGRVGQKQDPYGLPLPLKRVRGNAHAGGGGGCWAPLTTKRHIPPHSAQPRHTNDGALRTRKRHQREHRPQRPTERSDPTQHAKGRTGDCPGPRKETTQPIGISHGGGGGVHPGAGDGCGPGREFPRPIPSPHPFGKLIVR